jgi:2-polyprenyl-3-methyl-5-hydroxy-6-metoxy-1,4-benzoquinol methylase
VRCLACGFVYQNPQPDPESVLAAYQSVEDARYLEEREGRVHTFRRSLSEVEELAAPGRLLDVGCHLGVFVEVSRDRGWDATGVDPSRWAVETARARGLSVFRGTAASPLFEPASYDVVTLWDVIEHLPDPAQELRQMRRLLRPGGLLALSTMDVDAPIARLMGRHWPWYMQMHLYYFSQRTLRDIVERAGFRVLDVRRHRRVVRLAYLSNQIESKAGLWRRPLTRALEWTRLGRLLVGVDLGDIVTLFAVSETGRRVSE